MSQFSPAYTLLWGRPNGYGLPGLARMASLRTVVHVDASNAVSGTIGQANIQLADPDGVLRRDLNPQPMDVIRLSTNSRFSAAPVPIWTGYIDAVSTTFSPTTGNILQLSATVPWKHWEVTTMALSGNVNDAATIALAEVNGISARDMIRLSAQLVGYPGPLASLPQQPAGLQLYSGPEIAGLHDLTQPSSIVFTQPDQQTYGALIQNMLADTPLEFYADEFGSMVFRPVGYLTLQSPLPRLLPADILDVSLGLTDQYVYTQVRERWAFDATYAQDGFAQAPSTLAHAFGQRILIDNKPWIQSQDTATFYAKALLEMAASNIAVGTVTIPANPAMRHGIVIEVPSLVGGLKAGLYYIQGVIWSLQWGGTWVQTLQLSYGRDSAQQFPFTGTQTTAFLNPAGLTDIPVDGQVNGAGQITIPVQANSTYAANAIAAPYPVGTTLIVTDGTGHAVGSSPNGHYIVTQQIATNAPVTMQTTDGVTRVQLTQVQTAPQPSPVTSSTTSGPPQTPVPSSPTTNQANGAALPTPNRFAFWPISVPYVITQGFGVVSPSAANDYETFHNGIDIAVPKDTPIRAPVAGVVVFAGADTTGFGNLVELRSGPYILYFAHQDGIHTVVGAQFAAGQFGIGLVDTSGTATGPHLHFGVYDTTTNQFINPAPFLQGARHGT